MRGNKLIRNVLGDSYLNVGAGTVYVNDDTRGGCGVRVNICSGVEHDRQAPLVTGFGVGMVDALFDAFTSHYAQEYESLKTIELHGFKVLLNKNKTGLAPSSMPGADSFCEAALTIRNSYGSLFDFTSTSCSLAAAVAHGVAKVAEHFLNAERAYVALHVALRDAKDRGRTDLITRYIAEMAEVVRCTSYSGVLDKIQKDLEQ